MIAALLRPTPFRSSTSTAWSRPGPDNVSEGVRRLGELLERLPFDARPVLDSTLELHPGEDHDDVAVLVTHVP
jgi:hypothetical protein